MRGEWNTMKLDPDIIEAHKKIMIGNALPSLEESFAPNDVDIRWNEVEQDDCVVLSMTVINIHTNETILHRLQKVRPLYG